MNGLDSSASALEGGRVERGAGRMRRAEGWTAEDGRMTTVAPWPAKVTRQGLPAARGLRTQTPAWTLGARPRTEADRSGAERNAWGGEECGMPGRERAAGAKLIATPPRPTRALRLRLSEAEREMDYLVRGETRHKT